MHIRIIDVPDGEAPEDVRRAWVGMVLPVAPGEKGPRCVHVYGVRTAPKTVWGYLWDVITGKARNKCMIYAVRCESAFRLLSEVSPTALEWWKQNTPQLFRPNSTFGFQVEVSERIADAAER